MDKGGVGSFDRVMGGWQALRSGTRATRILGEVAQQALRDGQA